MGESLPLIWKYADEKYRKYPGSSKMQNSRRVHSIISIRIKRSEGIPLTNTAYNVIHWHQSASNTFQCATSFLRYLCSVHPLCQGKGLLKAVKWLKCPSKDMKVYKVPTPQTSKNLRIFWKVDLKMTKKKSSIK